MEKEKPSIRLYVDSPPEDVDRSGVAAPGREGQGMLIRFGFFTLEFEDEADAAVMAGEIAKRLGLHDCQLCEKLEQRTTTLNAVRQALDELRGGCEGEEIVDGAGVVMLCNHIIRKIDEVLA